MAYSITSITNRSGVCVRVVGVKRTTKRILIKEGYKVKSQDERSGKEISKFDAIMKDSNKRKWRK